MHEGVLTITVKMVFMLNDTTGNSKKTGQYSQGSVFLYSSIFTIFGRNNNKIKN